ncbi:hypothetical protein EK21DRAFT_75066 [Setomelanomma holmii]|uniref:MYND-type domain-containing protein n=1 Tax=Setomelanomma holmii TaxID=210430 RepID=A0A9P4H2C6_9PLEO|nr:hypothetical protein EK21DRAFT_75066 [Setomelanomma holmii]
MSVYLDPPLCANNNQKVNGIHIVCEKKAAQCCGSCNLVQYCSKECQVADWPHHKKTCKSAFMKDKWIPDWCRTGRKPAFIGYETQVTFGSQKYLWGNMAALDILALAKNEGVMDHGRDLHLLFAASGDLRNVVKTIAGIPKQHTGGCIAVINDKDFAVVARNAIMLLIALSFDVKTAVPMILHLWYSALLPAAMVHTLQSTILPLVVDVCEKIKDKTDDSRQAKTFSVNDRKLRLVLRKEEWMQLMDYFYAPAGLTAEEADNMRRRITLAPERIDYRERAMLQWSPALRQAEQHFREDGIMLPYACSSHAFDTPNPTLFRNGSWPMKDNASPRGGWDYSEYIKFAPSAKADEFGAMFFYLRDLLSKFCNRIRGVQVSFYLFCDNAQELEEYVGDMKFDRIEMANICDRGYLGPHKCLQLFSQLLKPNSENPHATLLMLFLNAAKEEEHILQSSDTKIGQANLLAAMQHLVKYMPMEQARAAKLRNSDERQRSPDFISLISCCDHFKDWDFHFGKFLDEAKLAEFAEIYGLAMKETQTLVKHSPCSLRVNATQEEFDILRSSYLSGWERYVEFGSTE